MLLCAADATLSVAVTAVKREFLAAASERVNALASWSGDPFGIRLITSKHVGRWLSTPKFREPVAGASVAISTI